MIAKRSPRTRLIEGSTMWGWIYWGYEKEPDPILMTRDWWVYIGKLYLSSFRGDFGVQYNPE